MTSSGTEDHTTPGDDPEAYVAEDRRWALAGGRSIDGRVTGTTLFADVSGFTALTEALAGELGPQRGAEELTGALERVFGALIGCLHEVGGAVVYFSGDAITAWIDGDTGRRAVSAAFAMQDAMNRVGRVTSPAGATVDLGVKVAVAGGNARRFVVGDPAIQLIDVLAGSLMDEVADAEGAAFPGEVVVTERVLVALGEDAVDVEKREGTLGRLACVGELARREPPTSGYADSDPLPEDTVRRWLLPAVYERMRAGRGEFLAELRPAVPVFVKFEGIDFDGDDAAPELLDAFMVSAQRVIDSYGGTLLQLTVGDKGAYIYAVFGTPEAHEDDAARACAAALELLTLQNDTITGMQVGVASGRLRSGTYGHRRRRTFCCLGDAVNLAARLMSKAPVGGVLVADEVRRAAGSGFHVGPVELLHLKGKARATAAARLLGISSEADAVASVGLPLVGRDAALDVVVAHLEQVDAGRGLLLGLVGASGIGKTRLLEEASARAVDRGLVVVRGTARSYGAIAPYSAWWGIGRQLLGVRDEMDVPTLLDHLHQLLPAELAARAPLLGSVLGMPLPDNELTATLDAKLRKASVEDLVDRLLRQRVRTPTALVLDDAHLLEPLGRDLLVVAARAATVLPLALLLGYQPADGALLGLDLPGLTHELVLDPLPVEDARSLAVAELTALGFPEAVHAEAVDLAVGRADGNPLWVRELCRYVVERAGDDDDAPLDALDLPGTLHGLVLSRLDRLDETPRRTAKVASVAGVVFTAGLVRQSYPDLGEAGDVRRSLQELDRRDVAQTEDVADDRWAFTHALLRDVAYESLPFALRTTLHGRMGEAIEAGALGDPARRLDDLAHHFWHSDDDDKKRTYLMAAGVAAQTAYANDAALGSFRRLLTLLASEEQGDVLVRIGKILELQGDWPAAHDAFSEALRLAEEHLEPRAAAWARTWLAEVARKQGHFEDSLALLAAAADEFAAVGDDHGAGQVWHFSGTLAAQQGDLDAARERYERSLAIRESLGDSAGMAALFSNLAIVAEYSGDYEHAEDLAEQGLALRRELGDRWGIGISQNNLGMLATLRGDPEGAKRRFEESMRLHAEVGDAWMVALGHNNLGNAARDLGEHDEARASYSTALSAYRGYADLWVLAILFEDVAILDAALGRPESGWLLVGAADALHARLGSPRTPDSAARIHAALDELSDQLPTTPEDLRTRGAALSDAAVDRLVRAEP